MRMSDKTSNKKYYVTLNFSTFCTYEVEAKDKNEAFEKAQEADVDRNEIIGNLEPWPEADITEVE